MLSSSASTLLITTSSYPSLLLTMTFLISWFILYNEIAFYSTRIFGFLYLAPSPLSPNGSAASAPTDAVQTVQRALTWQYSMHHFCYELKCTNFAKMQWDCNRDLRSFVQHCGAEWVGPLRGAQSGAGAGAVHPVHHPHHRGFPRSDALYCTVLHCTVLYCNVQYCTWQFPRPRRPPTRRRCPRSRWCRPAARSGLRKNI